VVGAASTEGEAVTQAGVLVKVVVFSDLHLEGGSLLVKTSGWRTASPCGEGEASLRIRMARPESR
jgi:hypothetical protein